MPATRRPRSNHLVIVCGHGIWRGGPAKGHDEAEWLIESYKAGETPTFVAHIRAGLQILADDPRAVVAFSGGPTRKETALSEGRSYANLAAANGYFGLLNDDGDDGHTSSPPSHPLSPIALHPRILVEEQALDSYYNILYSMLAFWRASLSSSSLSSGSWPARITIVSHAFKRTRLVEGHCGPGALAIAPLQQRVHFVGINPPNLPAAFQSAAVGSGPSTPVSPDAASAKAAAMKDATAVVDHWEADPHGVGALLAGKRRARNPWAVDQQLFRTDEERQRSGLRTQKVGAGGDMEALADDSPRPWNDMEEA